MKITDEAPSKTAETTAARKGVVLVDGHQYKDKAGRVHTLTSAPASKRLRAFMNLMQAKMQGGARFPIPEDEPEVFISDLDLVDSETEENIGHPFYFDFRNGIVGVMEGGDDVDTDANELVADITATNADGLPVTSNPVVKPTFLLEAGKTYRTRGGEAAGPLAAVDKNDEGYEFHDPTRPDGYFYLRNGQIFDDFETQDDLVEEDKEGQSEPEAQSDGSVLLTSLKNGQRFRSTAPGSTRIYTRNTEVPLDVRGTVVGPNGELLTAYEDDRVLLVQ